VRIVECSHEQVREELLRTSIGLARDLSDDFTRRQEGAARELQMLARSLGRSGSEALEEAMQALETEIGQDVVGRESEVLAHRLLQLSLTPEE
jgi:hypothetical protein